MISPSHPYEIDFQVLRANESSLGFTQRQLTWVLKASLGKIYYCMKALMDKSLIKTGNFSHK